ncbi:MAG TPA: hypothetical protein VN625_07000, partial [Desulfuromonadaceae bacterium]|nr:hypothetical protein [Desulfuromonadaceae bacterium]
MILNSIKWRLQLWYGLILVLVLGGFGATAYRLEYNQRIHRLDGELQRRFKTVADAMHQRGPRDQGGPPSEGPPDQMNRPPRIDLRTLKMFWTNQPGNYYFEVRRNGEVIGSAGQVPSRENTETVYTGMARENYDRGPDL